MKNILDFLWMSHLPLSIHKYFRKKDHSNIISSRIRNNLRVKGGNDKRENRGEKSYFKSSEIKSYNGSKPTLNSIRFHLIAPISIEFDLCLFFFVYSHTCMRQNKHSFEIGIFSTTAFDVNVMSWDFSQDVGDVV